MKFYYDFFSNLGPQVSALLWGKICDNLGSFIKFLSMQMWKRLFNLCNDRIQIIITL